jgi:diaminohydroxyphosphoribosylaminopyrimidine deaminase / 5-amino-6-(5-phosphoribosylamino)uracil reductase
MSYSPEQIQYMRRALQLAAKGAGSVAPNPMVGCVIVHQGSIIGEGYHQQYGQAHAEVNAINAVANKALLPQATMYVSLEPCAHFGKTPPCAQLLVQQGIQKVVICNTDPYPQVAGKGIAILQAAGIEVQQGLLEEDGRWLNRRFFTLIEKNRPYIILKWAQTANGYLALPNGQPLQISGAEANVLVHSWRAQEAAILIGTNTALTDNPQLNTRHWQGANPLRVVLDRQLRLPNSLRVFDGSSPTLLYNCIENEQNSLYEKVKLDNNQDFLQQVFYDLAQRKVASVIAEGGSQILETLLKQKLYDEARVIIAHTRIPAGVAAPYINLQQAHSQTLGGDTLYTTYKAC